VPPQHSEGHFKGRYTRDGIGCGTYTIMVFRATSHTTLKALDHGNVRALIGQKGRDRPSSLHTRR
jgi:hypothetical protein